MKIKRIIAAAMTVVSLVSLLTVGAGATQLNDSLWDDLNRKKNYYPHDIFESYYGYIDEESEMEVFDVNSEHPVNDATMKVNSAELTDQNGWNVVTFTTWGFGNRLALDSFTATWSSWFYYRDRAVLFEEAIMNADSMWDWDAAETMCNNAEINIDGNRFTISKDIEYHSTEYYFFNGCCWTSDHRRYTVTADIISELLPEWDVVDNGDSYTVTRKHVYYIPTTTSIDISEDVENVEEDVEEDVDTDVPEETAEPDETTTEPEEDEDERYVIHVGNEEGPELRFEMVDGETDYIVSDNNELTVTNWMPPEKETTITVEGDRNIIESTAGVDATIDVQGDHNDIQVNKGTMNICGDHNCVEIKEGSVAISGNNNVIYRFTADAVSVTDTGSNNVVRTYDEPNGE